jgi:hypothetical protein
MGTETFVTKKFSAATLATIEKANEILAEYETQGLVLTLRQVFYQFVSRGLMPNKQTEYKRLGGIMSDARLAGLVDWSMMEDRTRYLRETTTWKDPANIVEAVAEQYKEDLWRTQDSRPEVWIEKDALVGVIEKPCRDLRIPFFACRGYASQSAQYEAGLRFRRHIRRGQRPVVFHFGDHDPSGMDMTRDNTDRLGMFSKRLIRVKRLALNFDQVEQYNPPPNPAKETDSRATNYIEQYGGESWELDALEPTVIGDLIRNAVTGLINQRKWDEAVYEETANRAALKAVSNRWDDVREFVGEQPPEEE